LIDRYTGGPGGNNNNSNDGGGGASGGAGGSGGGAAAFVPSNELDRLHSFYDHGQPIGFNVNVRN
jgi:hypothetical protein